MADIPSKPPVSTVAWINGQTRLNHSNLTAGVNTNLLNIKTAVDGIIDVLEEGVESAPMKEVTYSELKALRDGGQLLPGQQYRITNYDTYTAQSNTSSAHHQFDIIVTADTESQLNEDARACGHQGDTYFATAFESQSNVQFEYVLYDDSKEEKYDSKGIAHYDDTIMEGRYESGIPTLYKTNTGEYGDEIDYGDCFTYEGDIEFNGVQYNKWYKTEGPEHADTGLAFLTRIIVVNNQFVEDVAVTKIATAYSCSSWKLKYCLDNDQRRFLWADVEDGKGVIYRMIDEWGNDCPYDFKNIRFVRNIYDGKYSPDNEGDDAYLYTFSYIQITTSGASWLDASLAGNDGTLTNQDNAPSGVFNNIIGRFYDYESEQETLPKSRLVLNDIVFIGSSKYKDIFDGFHSNIFGDNCKSNTLSGNYFEHNKFGYYCYNNILSDSNMDNVFGDGCYRNVIGPDCYHNVFGNTCVWIKLLSDCRSIEFGENCRNIEFVNPYCRRIKIDAGCEFLEIGRGAVSPDYNNQLQNVHIHYGVKGASVSNPLIVSPDRNLSYSIDYYFDSNGNLVTLDDRIDNKIVAAINANY